MSIVLVGLNHQTAPVSVRETLAFGKHALPDALARFVDGARVREGLIISTCTRVELLSVSDAPHHDAVGHVKTFLHHFHARKEDLSEFLYERSESDAVKHVFRVASSLDSMVVGEPQILGQVKQAYTAAQQVGTTGIVLNKLMHKAFSVAKRVRTETRVSSNAVSISFAAVELARRIFGTLTGHTVMLVGAGEMAELAVHHLLSAGAKKIIVTSRSIDKAEQLAQRFNGESLAFDDYLTRIAEADILIFATAAPHFIISPTDIRTAMAARRNKPMFIIDIAVPRNVDPLINSIENLFVYDVDDLQTVVANNLNERHVEAQRAEGIVNEEVERFEAEIRALSAGPFIAALNDHLSAMAEAEFERHRKRLERFGTLSPDMEEYIRRVLIGSILKKFAHPLIQDIRESAVAGTHSPVCNAFHLDVTSAEAPRRHADRPNFEEEEMELLIQ